MLPPIYRRTRITIGDRKSTSCDQVILDYVTVLSWAFVLEHCWLVATGFVTTATMVWCSIFIFSINSEPGIIWFITYVVGWGGLFIFVHCKMLQWLPMTLEPFSPLSPPGPIPSLDGRLRSISEQNLAEGR